MARFDRKILIWAGDNTRADAVTRAFKKSGAAFSEVETVTTNIIPRLQDKTIEAFVLYDRGGYDNLGTLKMIQAVRNNRLASLLPILVIREVMEGTWGEEVAPLYDAGANLVCLVTETDQACHVLDSMLELLDKYKVGNLGRFTR
jgi:hypothetical protein